MLSVSVIEETYLSELSSRWLCQQALTDRVVVDIAELRGNQALAQTLEQAWLQTAGISKAQACASKGTLSLSYDLRHFSRAQLKARAGSAAGPA